MKKTILLLIICLLFTQLSALEAKSEILYQSDTETEFVLNEASETDPVRFIDMRFLKRLIAGGVDTNDDGKVSYAEAAAVTELDLGIEKHYNLSVEMIGNLTGIEAFVNLEVLHVYGNLLTSLDVSHAPNLRVLTCNMNMLTALDVSQNPMLEVLVCAWNHLTDLDISQNRDLKKLVCGHNQFTSLDLSNNLELTHLNCNSYTTKVMENCLANRPWPGECKAICDLDISMLSNLETLMVCGKGFETFDFSNNTQLKVIYLFGFRYDCPINVWWTPANVVPDDVYLVEISCANTVLYTCNQKNTDGDLILAVDESNVDQVRIYPNPAVNFITVEAAGTELSTVNIFSLNGKVLKSEHFNGGSHTLDLSEYNKGMYLVNVRTGDRTMTKKILLK